jgi:fumarate reductase subunit C
VTDTGGPRYPSYVRKVPRTWWLSTRPYRRFAAREFTAVPVAGVSVVLLLFLAALSRGREAYQDFLRWLEQPLVVVFAVLVLCAVLYHTATWFRLSARILSVRVGRWAIPPGLVLGVMVSLWVVASAGAAYLVVWF